MLIITSLADLRLASGYGPKGKILYATTQDRLGEKYSVTLVPCIFDFALHALQCFAPPQVTTLDRDPPYFISQPVTGTNDQFTFLLEVSEMIRDGYLTAS
jgi:hypothetical protein